MSREPQDTRRRILEVTWKLLEAGRGREVRMSDIARKAGISRQAVYLHFPTRAELLVATTRHIDDVEKVEDRLAPSRAAATGARRLDAFIEAWGGYIPVIHGVARALMAMQDTDEAARAAWDGRMQAVREGCRAAVEALRRDGGLAPGFTPEQATDILWTLLSVRNWEQLTIGCGWSQAQYIAATKTVAHRALMGAAAPA